MDEYFVMYEKQKECIGYKIISNAYIPRNLENAKLDAKRLKRIKGVSNVQIFTIQEVKE